MPLKLGGWGYGTRTRRFAEIFFSIGRPRIHNGISIYNIGFIVLVDFHPHPSLLLRHHISSISTTIANMSSSSASLSAVRTASAPPGCSICAPGFAARYTPTWKRLPIKHLMGSRVALYSSTNRLCTCTSLHDESCRYSTIDCPSACTPLHPLHSVSSTHACAATAASFWR